MTYTEDPYAKEVIEINKYLAENFGIDTYSEKQMWRVTWANDEFEVRLCTHTEAGIEMLLPTYLRVPKYRQTNGNQHVLEHLCAVPIVSQKDIPEFKKSYEPIHFFIDKNDNPLPPRADVCKIIIVTVEAAMDMARRGKPFDVKAKLIKEMDEDKDRETSLLNEKKRIDEIIEYLFGEQSGLQGTTVTGESVIVPSNYNNTP